MRVFIGYDSRQPLAYNVLQHSIVRHSSKPVSITPLILNQLPIKRRGLTDFTYSRFLVPWLCDFKGFGVFMDADMVVRSDIVDLFEQADKEAAVSVMLDQHKFEWGSMMVFNNEKCSVLTPEFIEDTKNPLLDLAWAGTLGSIKPEWNHCVGYAEPRGDAKLYHYTQGIPCWPETNHLDEDPHWIEERAFLTKTCSWKDLMGKSVHAKPVLQRLFQWYTE